MSSTATATLPLASGEQAVGRFVLARNIEPLTGIRFFAAMWVVLFHLREQLAVLWPGFSSLSPIVLLGHYAVPMFFILSGFILSHTYFERYSLASHGEFVFLRFARLWPVHLVAIVTLLGYAGILNVLSKTGVSFSDGSFAISKLPAELTMVRTWWEKELLWNYPAWSIHCEWFAYLFIFPTAFLSFSKIRHAWVAGLCALFLVVVHSFLPLEFFRGRVMEIVLLFMAGSALHKFRVLDGSGVGRWAAWPGMLLLAAGVLWPGLGGRLALHLGFLFLIVGVSYNTGTIARILGWKPVVYGGAISYSIYMTHAPVARLFSEIVKRLPPANLAMSILTGILLLAAVLLVASCSYHLVEAPCNKSLRSFWHKTLGRKRL